MAIFEDTREKVIVAVLAALTLSAIGYITGVVTSLRNSIILPSGTIAYFEDGCPATWQPYNAATGRFIIGAGEDFEGGFQRYGIRRPDGSVEERDLPIYQVRDPGGSAHILLGTANMAPHSHEVGTLTVATSGQHSHSTPREASEGGWTTYEQGGADSSRSANVLRPSGQHSHQITGSTGTLEPATSIEVMPPYLPLLVCRKQ